MVDAPVLGNLTLPIAAPTLECHIDDGDTAWVLVSTVLVLGMMPALAFFEAGLLRSKNTLSIVAQVLGGQVVLAFMWDLFGYSLVFGADHGGVIGSFEHSLLIGVDYGTCGPHATNIAGATFALFQMQFGAITPLLMTGSFAERVRWRSFFILTIIWEILVFYPIAHAIWGGGWLQQLGALDFAGGIVIHTSAGISALVIAIMLGRRKGFDKYHGEFPPSNLPLACVGAAMLWMGWFGFNAGSALSSDMTAVSAVASTQIAACTSGTVWLIISWIRHKPSSVALINGVIAGLAGITPASGYISSQSTIVIGLLLGFASYFSVWLMKHKLRVDDALDVSSVHGLTGLLGALAIGICSQKELNPSGADGWIFSGSARLLGIQTLAIVVTMVHAGLITFLIVFVLDKTLGFKSTEEEEELGLDHVEHREAAYNMDMSLNGGEEQVAFVVDENHKHD